MYPKPRNPTPRSLPDRKAHIDALKDTPRMLTPSVIITVPNWKHPHVSIRLDRSTVLQSHNRLLQGKENTELQRKNNGSVSSAQPQGKKSGAKEQPQCIQRRRTSTTNGSMVMGMVSGRRWGQTLGGIWRALGSCDGLDLQPGGGLGVLTLSNFTELFMTGALLCMTSHSNKTLH